MQFIEELEALANECKKKADALVDRTVKKMDGDDEQRIQVLIAALTSLMNIYTDKAIYASQVNSKSFGATGKPNVDLTINGETVEARITKYVKDLQANVKTFASNGPDDKRLIALGLPLLSLPLFKAVEIDRHRKQIVARERGRASSAAFLSNLDRNIFGNIFYAGRLAEAQLWQTIDIRAVLVTTRQDSLVCEQCIAMAGLYPYDYVFTGNHPKCRCTAEPVTIGSRRVVMDKSILDYALKNKDKFGEMMVYKLNDKYY